ncbi:unnamed protein product [Paramecium sonneborni]|uniref:MORN repeat protein n=1 Tax=Paramecium sonneborni TaxID=65129 RepID=A0A8S1RNX6_9CILI|nr:unnamed protein product [Paramecium sonneborni]
MDKDDLSIEARKLKLIKNEQQLNENTRVIEGLHNYQGILQKTYFLIKFTTQGEIQYINNGIIIRIDKISNPLNENEIMKNIEQINFLSWLGEYGVSQQKVRFWKAKWKGMPINVGGLYNQEGNKDKKWKDLHINFWDKSQIIENGEYINGKRVGVWEILLDDQIIGMGTYDIKGNQNGLWIEPNQKFYKAQQIFYSGKYRAGSKIGEWICYEKKLQSYLINSQTILKIGGGNYNNNGIKQGQWIELHENFSPNCQVYYQGKYYNGKKYGKWETKLKNFSSSFYKKIGGGDYDQNGLKHGYWIDLHEYFSNTKKFIETGKYEHGMKTENFQEKEI